MARIDWNPIAIPDIGESALRAQQAAGNSVRTAFQDLSGVLDQWKGQRRNEVLSDITRQQLRFSDPEQMQAAIASGQINLQSDYLNPEDMMRIAGYQDTLAQRRNAQTAYEQGNTRFENDQTLFRRGTDTYERTERERVAFQNANADLLDDLQAARVSGDREAYGAALQAVRAANPNLSAEQIVQLAERGDSAVGIYQRDKAFSLDQRSGESRLNQDNIEFGQGQDDRTDSRNVQLLLAATQQLAGANFDDKSPGGGAEMALSMAAESGQYTPRQIAAAAQQLGISAPASVLALLRSEESNTSPSFSGNGGNNGGSGAVGDRNNNPGNVRDVGQFRGQAGYLGTDSRGFARFSSPEAGANVAVDQLRLYMNGRSRNVPRGGIRTINDIVRTWAPVGPENSAESVANYQAYVARRLGVKVDDELTEADIPRLAAAMGEFENGRTVQGRYGPTLSLNTSDLERSGNRARAEGRLPELNPSDPTSFIPAFESRMSNAIQGLSRQQGAAGLDAAANYNATQALRRNPGTAAAAALAAGTNGAGGGVFAGSRVNQRMLEEATIQLMRAVPDITADTAIRVLADGGARVNGGNYLEQAMGNVRALGGGVRIDMVRATQIARALNGNGGALLAENGTNITRGQQRAAALTTQMNDAFARYKAGVASDAARFGEGQVSPMTRAYGERLFTLQTQLEEVSRTAEASGRAYRGERPAAAPARGAAPAGRQPATPARTPPPPVTPQREVDFRTRRQRFITDNARWFGAYGTMLAPIINNRLDQADRNRR